MKRLALLIAVVASNLFIILSCSREDPVVRETFVMGTKARISVYGMEEDAARRAAGKAFHELHRLEGLMSTWNQESELSRLNRNRTGTQVKVSPELAELIWIAGLFSELTDGAFDITAMPLVRLWGFQGGEKRMPSSAEIEGTLLRTGAGKVKANPSDNTVTLSPGSEIDVAGIAKGYGVDRCVQILASEGVESALVDLGGNIYAIGAPPGKRGWVVGIRDPIRLDKITGYAIIKDEAIATSGNYENFVEIDGKRIGHIIDPRNGIPVSGKVLGVTVISPTALSADALSTALFVLGPEKGSSVLRKISREARSGGVPYLSRRPSNQDGTLNYADAVFILDDGGILKHVKTSPLVDKVFLEE